VKCENIINQKEREKGRNHCAYTEYINSGLQSGAEKWNPADIAQIITSVTAEMEKDEQAVREWNTEPISCEWHLQFCKQFKNNQDSLKWEGRFCWVSTYLYKSKIGKPNLFELILNLLFLFLLQILTFPKPAGILSFFLQMSALDSVLCTKMLLNFSLDVPWKCSLRADNLVPFCFFILACFGFFSYCCWTMS